MSPLIRAVICRAIELGHPRKMAATMAGVSLTSISRWDRLGREDLAADPPRPDTDHARFAAELLAAREAHARRHLAMLEGAA